VMVLNNEWIEEILLWATINNGQWQANGGRAKSREIIMGGDIGQ